VKNFILLPLFFLPIFFFSCGYKQATVAPPPCEDQKNEDLEVTFNFVREPPKNFLISVNNEFVGGYCDVNLINYSSAFATSPFHGDWSEDGRTFIAYFRGILKKVSHTRANGNEVTPIVDIGMASLIECGDDTGDVILDEQARINSWGRSYPNGEICAPVMAGKIELAVE